MRCKPTSSLSLIVRLAGLVVVLCVCYALANTNIMSKDLPNPNVPLNVPGFCRSTNDIKAYFDQQGVPVELKEAKGKYETYCFVLAYPYSGIDTTDLYCFVQRGEGWLMFLKAALWKTRHGTVEFKSDGDFMNIVRDGAVVLKLNPPK